MVDDDLLTLADAEISQLRLELDEARAALQQAIEAALALASENAELYRRAVAREPAPPAAPLEGLRVGIIGHPSRESDYRAVIERLGGQLLFTGAGDKLGLIDRVVQKSHGTLYLTAWGSHKASQRAESAARRYSRPLVLSDQPGLAMVERTVVEQLLPLIRDAASP
ncbi:MAG: hypothetical protein ACOY93_12270 [Bacillota bacterium]